MTEAWFRNPSHYARELAEVGYAQIVWHRGKLSNLGIDPKQHAELYFSTLPYRLLLVGGEEDVVEVRSDSTVHKPTAVYPTWSYGTSMALLEELLQQPVGENEEACSDKSVPVANRPVLGQEHRIIILDSPSMGTSIGRTFAIKLVELQREYPEAIIHVYGRYGYRTAFGLGFGAVDVEPREAAAKGKIALPMGKEIKYEQAPKHAQWVTMLGFALGDLAVPRNRCIYNIKSAMWAAENYDKNIRFPVKNGSVDPSSATPAQVGSYRSSTSKPKTGDKMLCDTCSLAPTCKYYREGAVCSVPDAPTSELAKMFGVRDANQIIGGLNKLLSRQADRYERGLRREEIFEDIDPEVTKIGDGLFSNGVKLAKLMNPALAGSGTRVGVVVNTGQGGGGTGSLSGADPRAMTAGLVAALEAQGIPRERITPKMLEAVLKNGGDPEAASQVIDVTPDEE